MSTDEKDPRMKPAQWSGGCQTCFLSASGYCKEHPAPCMHMPDQQIEHDKIRWCMECGAIKSWYKGLNMESRWNLPKRCTREAPPKEIHRPLLPKTMAGRLELLLDLYAPIGDDGERHPGEGVISAEQFAKLFDAPQSVSEGSK